MQTLLTQCQARPEGHFNIHVGVQRRRKPAELLGVVPGDSAGATWMLDATVTPAPDGGVDLKGPYIQGQPGGRFIYLNWWTADPPGTFTMFRRAKLRLDAVCPEVLGSAREQGCLVARVILRPQWQPHVRVRRSAFHRVVRRGQLTSAALTLSAFDPPRERDKQSSPGVRGRGWLAPASKWDNSDVTWIELEGAVNVRDLGGLPTTDGGTIVAGRLLRSENLQELSPGDVSRLVDQIGVTTVVDLRSTNEVEIEGPAPLDAVAGVRHAHHPVLRELLDVSDTVKAALLTEAVEADRARYPDDPTCGHYLGYLENRPEEVTGALRSVATAPGAAIVHCAAGKDRTGVVVALALAAAGVEQEAIVADYAASEERIEAIIERLARSKMYAGGVNGTSVRAHAPRAETMKAFLEQLETRYGGVETWLTVNGFSAEELSQLRAKLRQA